jgi:hypothetical protein
VEFKPYSREEFLKVAVHVLKVREGLSEEEAGLIAGLLADSTRDVRDAVKAARLYRAGASTDLLKRFFAKGNSKGSSLHSFS